MQKLERDDIVSILKSEHDLVRSNLKQILDNDAPMRGVFAETGDAMLNHFNGEEKLVFPQFENKKDTARTVYALIDEHSIVRREISEMNALTDASDDERWMAKAVVLNGLAESHFEMEENQVFPKAEKMLSSEQREEVGRRYKNKQF